MKNAATIEIEPYNFRLVAMPLVRMLRQRISWADREEIACALIEVQLHHERLMKEHRDHMTAAGGQESAK